MTSEIVLIRTRLIEFESFEGDRSCLVVLGFIDDLAVFIFQLEGELTVLEVFACQAFYRTDGGRRTLSFILVVESDLVTFYWSKFIVHLNDSLMFGFQLAVALIDDLCINSIRLIIVGHSSKVVIDFTYRIGVMSRLGVCDLVKCHVTAGIIAACSNDLAILKKFKCEFALLQISACQLLIDLDLVGDADGSLSTLYVLVNVNFDLLLDRMSLSVGRFRHLSE